MKGKRNLTETSALEQLLNKRKDVTIWESEKQIMVLRTGSKPAQHAGNTTVATLDFLRGRGWQVIYLTNDSYGNSVLKAFKKAISAERTRRMHASRRQ